MYQVEVRVRRRSAHRLINYEGKCNNLHGEGYTGIFIFEGSDLNKSDMLIDFGKVKPIVQKDSRQNRLW